tara:strand:+ start:377 stop:748 length:372 start_codon:yes stop_codon:yes gene_type:complete
MLTDIITPKSIVFSDDLDFLIVPGTEGDIGVLDNHSHLITSIRPGLVYGYKNEKILKRYYLNEGIFEFSNNSATLLTEFAEEVEKIDHNELNKQISEAQKNNDQHKLIELKTKKDSIENQFYF